MFYEQVLTKTSTKTQTHMEVPHIVKLNRLNWKKRQRHRLNNTKTKYTEQKTRIEEEKMKNDKETKAPKQN